MNDGAARARDGWKAIARAEIEAWGARLVALSHDLHAHPELAWHEHRSAGTCAALLDEAGLPATVGVHGLPTAFRADVGTTGPIVALCCEYDALPGLGHACAHNLIAAAGIGAAIGLRPVVDEVPLRVRVLGTPAEENTGGKIDLLADGAFEGVAAAMMVHAYAHDVADFASYAADDLTVRFASPGDSAAVADVAAQLGQHAPDGVVVRSPEPLGPTSSRIAVRAIDGERLARCRAALTDALRAAVPGVEVAGLGDRCYAEFRGDPALAEAYRANAAALGRGPFRPGRADACTDMGNVSRAIPSLHAMVAIGEAYPHSAEFAAAAVSERADRTIVESAIAMAWTAIDVATDFLY